MEILSPLKTENSLKKAELMDHRDHSTGIFSGGEHVPLSQYALNNSLSLCLQFSHL